MLLYLVRHAHALNEEQDASRPLSSRGIDCARRLADFFKQNGAFTPLQLWHSPLRRSHQTAEILVRGLNLDCGMIETSDLLPEDDPEETVARLSALISTQSLAIVGHEPHLSSLATMLVRDRPSPVPFQFKKGTVLALERTDEVHKKSGNPRWLVAWHFTPALLPARPVANGSDGMVRNPPIT